MRRKKNLLKERTLRIQERTIDWKRHIIDSLKIFLDCLGVMHDIHICPDKRIDLMKNMIRVIL